MKIVKITNKHLPELAIVLSEAFSKWRIKRLGSSSESRIRRNECMLPYVLQDPNGCFVAMEGKKIVGGIFSHVWGKMGWVGTFGVLPNFQQKGIGKELMNAAINYLDKEKNVTKLALETMPDSVENIALYSKLGFRPAFHTIVLEKPINFSEKSQNKMYDLLKSEALSLSLFSDSTTKKDILMRCAWLADKIDIGLDYSPEIDLISKNNFGDTILLEKDGFVIGFACCRTISRYKNIEEDSLAIKILIIDIDIPDKTILDLLLLACERFGQQNNKKMMRIYINSSYWTVYNYLLKNHFRIRSSLLRMIRFSDDIKAFDHHSDWIVNCSSLTM